MATVAIRAPLPEEAGAISALVMRSKAHWGYDAAFLDAVRDELRVHPEDLVPGRAWVAEADGAVAGFCRIDGAPPLGELAMLFVDPASMGAGVGRALVDAALHAASEQGFAALGIEADPDAEPFYLRVGAVHVGSVPSGSIEGRMLPLLRIEVAPPGGGGPRT